MVAAVRMHSTFEDEFQELSRSIEQTPASATVKGMFFESVLKGLDREGLERPTRKRYIAFKEYSLRELMETLLHSTTILHPTLAPKEGLRRLGRLVYPTLSDSTVGKVLFSIAGRDWKSALNLTGRAYKISLDPGEATVKEVTETSAIVSLRNIYNFPDSYQPGVFEGAMDSFSIQGTVTARPLARACDVDLILEWEA